VLLCLPPAPSLGSLCQAMHSVRLQTPALAQYTTTFFNFYKPISV
jgi:hypothetical protein